MADEYDGSKTEAPTERRREEAREQGQVAHSQDFSGSALLVLAMGILWFSGPEFGQGLLDTVRSSLSNARAIELDGQVVRTLFEDLAARGGSMLGIMLALLLVAAVGVNVLQVGFMILPGLLAFNWERIALNWDKLFSVNGVVRGTLALGKVTLILVIVWWILDGRRGQVSTLAQGPIAQSVRETWDLVMLVALSVAAVMLALGVIDFFYHRFQHEQSLMMSRHELKDEAKREEGDPHIRARVRKLMRERSKQRMMQAVPQATVVIRNPTHLAIALRYERGIMEAPKVVAKGAGILAERIIEIALQHGVPTVERKPLAQALYKTVEVDREIPPALYHAVAEVMAYVFSLRTTG
jgi:flagellar biosynthetic protein FlhB